MCLHPCTLHAPTAHTIRKRNSAHQHCLSSPRAQTLITWNTRFTEILPASNRRQPGSGTTSHIARSVTCRDAEGPCPYMRLSALPCSSASHACHFYRRNFSRAQESPSAAGERESDGDRDTGRGEIKSVSSTRPVLDSRAQKSSLLDMKSTTVVSTTSYALLNTCGGSTFPCGRPHKDCFE